VPIIRRYCSGCDGLVPDQAAVCPHCDTPASAKRSFIKQYWKPVAAIATCALVIAAIQYIRTDHQNAGKSVALQPPAQKENQEVPPFVLALKPAPDPEKAASVQPSKVLEVPTIDLPAQAAPEEVAPVAEAAPAMKETPAASVDLVTEGSRLNDGRKLADIGSRLLERRRYAEAASVLRNAVEAFPPGTHDLSYGMALYKLGSALRLSGKADEAIPVLQRAMEFAWIRSQVSREIKAASVEAEKSTVASRH
jgi:tetratricopeptide (TPR) repeat protein